MMLDMMRFFAMTTAWVLALLFLFVPVATLASEATDPFARPVSTPEAEGMNATLLDAMLNAVAEQNARTDSRDTIDSVIVIRHGNVVLEAYPNPRYPATRVHHLFSVTKSITSLLVGIVLDLGLIDGLDEPILAYFPSAVPQAEVQSKSAITIEHLLTMSAGLEWDEDTYPTSDPRNDFTRLERSSDPIGFVLGKSLIANPGELFWYNSGLSHVLSALITEVSGTSTLDFAREHLLDPLGIGTVRWTRDGIRLYKGGTQLYMTPRDLARIGVLCLNDGVWDNRRVVSSEWLATSTRIRILGRPDYFAGRGYAYQWWTADEYAGPCRGVYRNDPRRRYLPVGAGARLHPALSAFRRVEASNFHPEN
jgi:CubicO group peptidase (beta-lactamase class C family)